MPEPVLRALETNTTEYPSRTSQLHVPYCRPNSELLLPRAEASRRLWRHDSCSQSPRSLTPASQSVGLAGSGWGLRASAEAVHAIGNRAAIQGILIPALEESVIKYLGC